MLILKKYIFFEEMLIKFVKNQQLMLILNQYLDI